MNLSNYSRLALVTVLGVWLTGCGGGGSDATPAASNTVGVPPVVTTPSVPSTPSTTQPGLIALDALSTRVKEQFDPRGILNPGRMVGEVSSDRLVVS